MESGETGSDSSKVTFVDRDNPPRRARRSTMAFKVLFADKSVCYVTATRSGKITCYSRGLSPGAHLSPGHGRRAKRKGRTGPCLEAVAEEVKRFNALMEEKQGKLPL